MQKYAIFARRSETEGAAEEVFLSVTEDSKTKFGFLKRKRGFIPVAAEDAQKALDAANAGHVTFILQGPPNNQDLYKVRMLETGETSEAIAAGAKTADTLEH
jgi:hypothetical protein